MIDIRIVSATDILDAENADLLYSLYAEEVKSPTIKCVNKPNREAYIQLEQLGMLDVVGLYDGDTLVGFISLLTTSMLHYSEKSSSIESQYILPKYRKFGNWKRAISAIEGIARLRGSRVLFMSAKPNSSLDKVASRSNFIHTDNTFTKIIS